MTSPFAIVAHDIGAANHIIAWLSTGLLDSSHAKICFQGPALKEYQKVSPNFINLTLDEALKQVHYVISGTGWASDLEHHARVRAKSLGIKSVAVLDHWVNYQQRFIRNAQEQLADEIWVVDEYAQAIAKELFQHTPIRLQHNSFLEKQTGIISYLQREKKDSKQHILFVMEPVRRQWGDIDTPGEIQSLNFMSDHLDQLPCGQEHSSSDQYQIIIRPHPSDPKGKYDEAVKSLNHLDISVNEESSLAALIAWSDVVVGCETYAMVVALSSGKKVVSALPSTAPPCSLPHREIIKLSELMR